MVMRAGSMIPTVVRSTLLSLLVCCLPESAASQAEWRISATPSLSIGEGPGGPESPIFGVSGIVRLSDGRIVVADRGPRLLIFDATGRYIRTLGRKGGGPGEFSSISGIQLLANDTVLVVDNSNRRISYFTADNGFGRSTTIPSENNVPRIAGALSDGTLVGSRRISGPSPSQGEGVWWIPREQQVFRFDVARRTYTILRTFSQPGGSLTIPYQGGTRILVVMGAPMPQPSVALAGRRIYVTTGEQFEIMVYPPDSRNPTIIRRADYEPRAMTQADLIGWFTEQEAFNSRVTIDFNRVQWNIPRGFPVSAISALQVDQEGNVWAEEGPWVTGRDKAWSVFAPSGRHIAQVVMPPGFRPFEMRGEAVLGVWTDALGVEHVQVRTLDRTP
jgi:hypothetical protein